MRFTLCIRVFRHRRAELAFPAHVQNVTCTVSMPQPMEGRPTGLESLFYINSWSCNPGFAFRLCLHVELCVWLTLESNEREWFSGTVCAINLICISLWMQIWSSDAWLSDTWPSDAWLSDTWPSDTWPSDRTPLHFQEHSHHNAHQSYKLLVELHCTKAQQRAFPSKLTYAPLCQ